MSKAILVLDEVEECEDCDLFYIGDFGRSCQLVDIKNDKKPNYCPLKELPESGKNCHVTEEEIDSLPVEYKLVSKYMAGFDDGWNACLDEICGREG